MKHTKTKKRRKVKLTPPTFYTLDQAIVATASDRTFTPFAQHLLGMDSRLLFYQFADELPKGLGYCPDKDHIYFAYTLPSITHEIAHMVEMSNLNRCLLPDWGMPIQPVSKRGAFVAFAREVRVFAIQRYVNASPWFQRSRLDVGAWFGTMQEALPFGKFTDMKQVEEWEKGMCETVQKQWSQDRVEHEWKKRLSFIQDWMERK